MSIARNSKPSTGAISHLQLRFLEFLGTPLGQRFRDGDLTNGVRGIRWVLVDEYQDTNLVQEEIYRRSLAANRTMLWWSVMMIKPYIDSAGSVECMVSFDLACQTFLTVGPGSVARYPLVANFRSHPAIVAFCNDYITAFPVNGATESACSQQAGACSGQLHRRTRFCRGTTSGGYSRDLDRTHVCSEVMTGRPASPPARRARPRANDDPRGAGVRLG